MTTIEKPRPPKPTAARQRPQSQKEPVLGQSKNQSLALAYLLQPKNRETTLAVLANIFKVKPKTAARWRREWERAGIRLPLLFQQSALELTKEEKRKIQKAQKQRQEKKRPEIVALREAKRKAKLEAWLEKRMAAGFTY